MKAGLAAPNTPSTRGLFGRELLRAMQDEEANADSKDPAAYAHAAVTLGSGASHYRQFFHPPTAAYVKGVLHLAFGSGEDKDILYQGEAGVDD